MAEIQTRGLTVGDAWRNQSTRPAGLYGELPPLPVQPPTNSGPSTLTRHTRRFGAD